jgi:GNAT superfamily N-acetyltransferase
MSSDASWRLATEADDQALIALSMALNQEDPGANPVPEAHIRCTLQTLRAAPWRGHAVVLETLGSPSTVVGYAFLISFWSNELGGEVCTIDELYVTPLARGRGLGAKVFDKLLEGDLWKPKPKALILETTPDNVKARRLYERNGFVGKNLSMRRLAT